jgi:hypothetical protein
MVLWNYVELFFGAALVFTILCFHESINRVGRTFFLMAGGVLWGMVSWSLQKVDFHWAGSINVIDYSYVAGNGENIMVSIFGFLGLLMFILGIILAMMDNLSDFWDTMG